MPYPYDTRCMNDTDGAVLDWADTADTVRVLLPPDKAGSAMMEAFWNLAGPCPDGPDLHVHGWYCDCPSDFMAFTD